VVYAIYPQLIVLGEYGTASVTHTDGTYDGTSYEKLYRRFGTEFQHMHVLLSTLLHAIVYVVYTIC
jgi:hypothetical protein